MAYCQIKFLFALLPKTVTVGDSNVTSPLLNKPGTAATIDTRTAQLFINFASQEIDARLSTVYLIPLKRVKTCEEDLTSDCRAGTKSVMVADNGAFRAGCLVRLGDTAGSEINEVDLLPDDASAIDRKSTR